MDRIPGRINQLLFIRSAAADYNSLRNAIYGNQGVVEISYGGHILGVSCSADPLHPCDDQRDGTEYAVALLKFGSREHALNFLLMAGFLDVSFLPECDIYLMPLLKPLKLGRCWSTFLITELVTRENYQYLPSRNKLYGIDEIGGVPVVVDTSYVDGIRSVRRQPAGFRIHQFPDKRSFAEWFSSRNGEEFKRDYRRISGLNTYLMSFF